MSSTLSLVFLLISLVLAQHDIERNVVDTIVTTNGNPNKGYWRRNEFCPAMTYATGFNLLVEPDQGLFGDDTAMNGLRLTCKPRAADPEDYSGVIEAYRGEWGDWMGLHSCSPDMFLTQFRQRVEKPGFLDDDTGVNNMDFFCRHFDFDSEGEILEGNGMTRGKWGEWSNGCPLNSAICGFETLYQGPAVDGNSALNDIKFYCCDD